MGAARGSFGSGVPVVVGVGGGGGAGGGVGAAVSVVRGGGAGGGASGVGAGPQAGPRRPSASAPASTTGREADAQKGQVRSVTRTWRLHRGQGISSLMEEACRRFFMVEIGSFVEPIK
jgi:hypothetical protein